MKKNSLEFLDKVYLKERTIIESVNDLFSYNGYFLFIFNIMFTTSHRYSTYNLTERILDPIKKDFDMPFMKYLKLFSRGIVQSLKELIEKKKQLIRDLPYKMSHQNNIMKFLLKIADNPNQFCEPLDYQNKKIFENIIFPEGFQFSMIQPLVV